MRARLRRLEQAAKQNYVSIPQQQGPPARFPPSATKEAFMRSLARLKGEDVPEHPLSTAAATSSDSRWRGYQPPNHRRHHLAAVRENAPKSTQLPQRAPTPPRCWGPTNSSCTRTRPRL